MSHTARGATSARYWQVWQVSRSERLKLVTESLALRNRGLWLVDVGPRLRGIDRNILFDAPDLPPQFPAFARVAEG